MKSLAVVIAGVAATMVAAGVPMLVQAATAARSPQEVWDQTCHACHDTGASNAPVILGAHIPADRVKAVVRNGGLEMGAFTEAQVSDAELDALAKWVSEHDAPAAK